MAEMLSGEDPDGKVYADLHVHTNHSDGIETIETVLGKACACGMQAVAITDHDAVDHWDEVRTVSERLGIEAVRGVEMSCYDDAVRKKIHVVGLWLGELVPHVKALCDHTLACRTRYHRALVDELRERGYDISFAEVERHAPFGNVFKIHLFQALVEKYPDEMTPQRYCELFANKTSYETDLQMGYTPIDQGIEAIRADGGVAVLAHPCEYDNYDEVPTYVELGLQGIEVSHPSMKPEDYPRTRELAERFGLLCSGGSDYHSDQLTPWMGRFGLDEKAFTELKERVSTLRRC